MDKGRNRRHISLRHKRLAQEETEKDYLLESSSSGATYLGPSVESTKECRIENKNDQSVSTSSSLSYDQEHINQPNFNDR